MELSTIDLTQGYYYIAVFATILFVIKLILFSIFGGDTEVVTDFTTEFDTDCSFDFISIQSLLAFLMGFGWTGYACTTEFNLQAVATLGCSVGCGLVFMFLSAYLMFLIKKLEKRVKKDKKTAVGKTGKAYTNIKAHGQGQVEIEVNGQLMVVDAINNTDCDINSFDIIKVVKVENEMLYVEKENNN